LIAPALVIPEAACGYPGSQQAPVFATIPDIAYGISGMTVSEAISRIWHNTGGQKSRPSSGRSRHVDGR